VAQAVAGELAEQVRVAELELWLSATELVLSAAQSSLPESACARPE
jgi:hypothetical protein